MAVKQNNTEGNGSSADGNKVNGGNGVKSTGTITKSKNMNSSGNNVENGDGSMTGMAGMGIGSTSNKELPGCSGNTGASSKPKTMTLGSNLVAISANLQSQSNDISAILKLIECLENTQAQKEIKLHQYLLVQLASVPFSCHSAEDLRRFKEDITKVGSFLAKNSEHGLYYDTYLAVVCQLINISDKPSCALAIIFQLFKCDEIDETVEKLLEHDVPNENIRQTVGLLCEWLPVCNFCQNLNKWITCILRKLNHLNKYDLIEQIALENIVQLWFSLRIPVLRSKVAPVVFIMLKFTDQTPKVFYEIWPHFSLIIKYLKQQSNSNEEYAEETKKVLQQLYNITSNLLSKFYLCKDLHAEVELVLKDVISTNNFIKLSNVPNIYDSTLDSTSPTQNANAKVGLVNLGNTCYMNSVLQALAMTKEFSREILLLESKSPLLMKMQTQIALMLYSSRQELTPTALLNATKPPGFSTGLQQDSSEFLGYLLESLHEQEIAFSKEKSNEIEGKTENIYEYGASSTLYNNEHEDDEHADNNENATTTNNQNISIKEAADSFKSTNLPTTTTTTDQISSSNSLNKSNKLKTQNISTIEKTFTGKLATTYKCLTCGWKSCNTDSFRDLQLSFPDVKNDCASNYSVQDLIEYYCSSEKLYGDNQYFCERCKKLSDAERYINVISAPKNLILTLKHFKYDQKYQTRAKLMHKVFHDEKVSLKVCSSEGLEEIATFHYDLYAGVVHSGFSMDSGHYYTYAADANNKWYKFNDNIVTPTTTEELHNLEPPNTPYILFYQMGARSNDSPETSASTKVIKVDVPTPLTLEELPRELRDIVEHDNQAFSKRHKIKRYKVNETVKHTQQRGSYEDDDHEQPPPASGCGDNALTINVDRFAY